MPDTVDKLPEILLTFPDRVARLETVVERLPLIVEICPL